MGAGSPSAKRALLGELIEAIIIKPVGRGHRKAGGMDPDRIQIIWKADGGPDAE